MATSSEALSWLSPTTTSQRLGKFVGFETQGDGLIRFNTTFLHQRLQRLIRGHHAIKTAALHDFFNVIKGLVDVVLARIGINQMS